MGRPWTILIRSNTCFISCRNHTSVSAKKTTHEIAVHFNKEKHLLSDFEFIVIEQIRNIDDKHNVENVSLQEKHFGVPNYALFKLMA